MEKKFECESCGAVVTVKDSTNPKQCICGSEDFKILAAQMSEEEIAEIKSGLGKAFEDMQEVIKNYMDMPKDQVKLVCIWILGTYLHHSFSTFPFLYLNAMRGSGKTRLLGLIAHLSKGGGGQVQTGITESVLFRMKKGETLVLDECEGITGKDKNVLREYLNACYKRGGIVKRLRKIKMMGVEKYDAETFKPFKPIAMANISGMDEVLGDRCISFILEKSNNPSKTKKIEDFEENPKIQEIKRTLEQFSVVSVVSLPLKTYITAWNDYVNCRYNDITTYTTQTTQTTHNNTNNNNEESFFNIQREEFFNKVDKLEIDGRNFELLFPLLIISRFLSVEDFEEMIEITKELVKLKKEDEFTESRDVSLYEFISKQECGLNFVQIKELTSGFRNFVGDEEVNEKWVGKALKRLNLLLDKKRMASGRIVRLNISKASEKLKIFKKGDGDD